MHEDSGWHIFICKDLIKTTSYNTKYEVILILLSKDFLTKLQEAIYIPKKLFQK